MVNLVLPDELQLSVVIAAIETQLALGQAMMQCFLRSGDDFLALRAKTITMSLRPKRLARQTAIRYGKFRRERHFERGARLWMEASDEQKQRLQKLFFSHGVNFAYGKYGTTEICPFFNVLEKNKEGKTGLATIPGIEPCFAIFENLRKSLLKPYE
jgi:hypothetical protein